MDPEFATRYLRETGDCEPAPAHRADAEPDVEDPSGPSGPGVEEPGADIGTWRERQTGVLPPVVGAPRGDQGLAVSGRPAPPGQPALTEGSAEPPARSSAATPPGGPQRPAAAPWPQGWRAGDPEPRPEPRWRPSDPEPGPARGQRRTAGPGNHRVEAPSESTGPIQPVSDPASYRHGGPRLEPPAEPVRGSRWGDAAGAHAPAEPGRGSSWGNGSGAHLRADELVKTRRLPAEMGWRKAVYVATGHLVNLGAGPAERTLRDQIAAIGTNIPGNYQIGVVSTKGGVGKTRTAAGIGTVYSMYRTEPVIAIDANPTYGNLGRLVDPSATASIREFMADDEVVTYPKARYYTGKNKQGLEVLGGNQNVANPYAMSEKRFTDTLGRTRRFYQLALIDCGHEIEHEVMDGVFPAVDALVIVGTMNFDGAEAAEKTIDWLAARNGHDLLRRSVVVLNDVHRCEDAKFVTKVRNSLGPRVGDVKTVPFDAHQRDGANLDFEALRRRTQLAYIEVAAWLAQGFPVAGRGSR